MVGFQKAERGNEMVRGEYLSDAQGEPLERDHPPEVAMYDVLYLDRQGSALKVASRLDRSTAAELARSEANRRRTGRMFLAGSERPCRGDIVVIVNDNDRTLQVH
jgi:hypothetical protein